MSSSALRRQLTNANKHIKTLEDLCKELLWAATHHEGHEPERRDAIIAKAEAMFSEDTLPPHMPQAKPARKKEERSELDPPTGGRCRQ